MATSNVQQKHSSSGSVPDPPQNEGYYSRPESLSPQRLRSYTGLLGADNGLKKNVAQANELQSEAQQHDKLKLLDGKMRSQRGLELLDGLRQEYASTLKKYEGT